MSTNPSTHACYPPKQNEKENKGMDSMDIHVVSWQELHNSGQFFEKTKAIKNLRMNSTKTGVLVPLKVNHITKTSFWTQIMPWLKNQLIENLSFLPWIQLPIVCKSILHSKVLHSTTVKEMLTMPLQRIFCKHLLNKYIQYVFKDLKLDSAFGFFPWNSIQINSNLTCRKYHQSTKSSQIQFYIRDR